MTEHKVTIQHVELADGSGDDQVDPDLDYEARHYPWHEHDWPWSEYNRRHRADKTHDGLAPHVHHRPDEIHWYPNPVTVKRPNDPTVSP